MYRNDLIERLKRLDEDADLMFDDDRKFNMIIVGGCALVLLGTITRATHDLDVLSVPNEIIDLLEKYDINTNVQAYMNNFPFNYEDRIKPLPIESRKINFYTASLEDIVVAKLYSSRPTDIADIEQESIRSAIDWELLNRLATAENVAKANALNDRNYLDFLANYDEYVKRFKP